MNVIHATDSLKEAVNPIIFLAGPTPRMDKDGKVQISSWRSDALLILEELEFKGTVLVPENEIWGCDEGFYAAQVEWEEQALKLADCILFWIPRRMDVLPGMTTNDEWGVWKKSGKVVLGVPPEAERCRYQIYYANKLNVPFCTTLENSIKKSISMATEVHARVCQSAQHGLWCCCQQVAENAAVELKETNYMTNTAFEPTPFQNRMQLIALHVHEVIVSAAEFLATPFRLLLEQVNGTANFRKFNEASGLPDMK